MPPVRPPTSPDTLTVEAALHPHGNPWSVDGDGMGCLKLQVDEKVGVLLPRMRGRTFLLTIDLK